MNLPTYLLNKLGYGTNYKAVNVDTYIYQVIYA